MLQLIVEAELFELRKQGKIKQVKSEDITDAKEALSMDMAMTGGRDRERLVANLRLALLEHRLQA